MTDEIKQQKLAAHKKALEEHHELLERDVYKRQSVGCPQTICP